MTAIKDGILDKVNGMNLAFGYKKNSKSEKLPAVFIGLTILGYVYFFSGICFKISKTKFQNF